MSQAELAVLVGSFGEETAEIPNASTPYILAPGRFFSPAVASGGWHLYPSDVVIELTGFDREPDPGPVRGFWGGIRDARSQRNRIALQRTRRRSVRCRDPLSHRDPDVVLSALTVRSFAPT